MTSLTTSPSLLHVPKSLSEIPADYFELFPEMKDSEGNFFFPPFLIFLIALILDILDSKNHSKREDDSLSLLENYSHLQLSLGAAVALYRTVFTHLHISYQST